MESAFSDGRTLAGPSGTLPGPSGTLPGLLLRREGAALDGGGPGRSVTTVPPLLSTLAGGRELVAARSTTASGPR